MILEINSTENSNRGWERSKASVWSVSINKNFKPIL